MLQKVFAANGLETLRPEGEVFDPKTMDAQFQVPDPEKVRQVPRRRPRASQPPTCRPRGLNGPIGLCRPVSACVACVACAWRRARWSPYSTRTLTLVPLGVFCALDASPGSGHGRRGYPHRLPPQ